MRWLGLSVLAACGFSGSGTGSPSDATGAPDGTAGSDARTPDATPSNGCATVAGLGVMLCPMTVPSGDLHVSVDTVMDTMTGKSTPTGLVCAALTPASAPAVCAIAASTITIDLGVTLSAKGGVPLALLATNAIDVEGTIDVSSQIGGQQGPASDRPGCDAGTAPTGDGGGQGGSFGGAGGNGGHDDNGTGKGLAGAPLAITTLRGGCPGAKGGGSNGVAGHGGGAVLLAAPAIAIGTAGTIDASGASGSGATQPHGGPGAGAGGMIVLAAPTITLATGGRIFANGGAGGGGASDANNGTPGIDSIGPPSGGIAGPGGVGGGGNGAPGFPASARDASNGGGGGAGGGGAGGGGAGVVKVQSASTIGGTNVSPPPS